MVLDILPWSVNELSYFHSFPLSLIDVNLIVISSAHFSFSVQLYFSLREIYLNIEHNLFLLLITHGSTGDLFCFKWFSDIVQQMKSCHKFEKFYKFTALVLVWPNFFFIYLKAFTLLFMTIFPVKFLMLFATINNNFTPTAFKNSRYTTNYTILSHFPIKIFKFYLNSMSCGNTN